MTFEACHSSDRRECRLADIWFKEALIFFLLHLVKSRRKKYLFKLKELAEDKG
jgi:hypothetical protein